MGNMTPEEMGNMTLGELKRCASRHGTIRRPVLQERTGQNCSQMGNRMMARDGQMGEDAGKNGAFSGRYFGESRHGPMGNGFSLLMQMDDLTADELNNMTLNQIKELQQKKMQELGNMTLNQINELRQKKMQAQNNMTLNELMAKQGNMREWADLWVGPPSRDTEPGAKGLSCKKIQVAGFWLARHLLCIR